MRLITCLLALNLGSEGVVSEGPQPPSAPLPDPTLESTNRTNGAIGWGLAGAAFGLAALGYAPRISYIYDVEKVDCSAYDEGEDDWEGPVPDECGSLAGTAQILLALSWVAFVPAMALAGASGRHFGERAAGLERVGAPPRDLGWARVSGVTLLVLGSVGLIATRTMAIGGSPGCGSSLDCEIVSREVSLAAGLTMVGVGAWLTGYGFRHRKVLSQMRGALHWSPYWTRRGGGLALSGSF